jgi:hypothetical protein
VRPRRHEGQKKGKDTLKGAGGKDLCTGSKGKDTASKCEVEMSI